MMNGHQARMQAAGFLSLLAATGVSWGDLPRTLVLHSPAAVPTFTPASTFTGNWDYPIISNNNDIVFADVAIAPSPDPSIPLLFSVLFNRRATPGSPLTFIAGDLFQAPSAPAGTLAFFPRDPRIDDLGRVAFITNFDRSGPVTPWTDEAIYFGTPQNPQLVVRAGDPAPGVPGMNIGLIPGHYALSQSSGIVAFDAFFVVAPEGNTAGRGMWAGRPGEIRLLARSGDPVPGMPGSRFDDFAAWCVNDAGEVAFSSQLDTVQADGVQDSVLCVSRPDGTLRVVARTGQQVPGMPEGITYWRLADNAFLDNAGHVAFFAFHNDLSKPPYERKAIMYGAIEAPQLLAVVGSQAPDLASGTEFSDLGGPFMSVSGQAMFRAFVRGPDITTANNFGIWRGLPGAVRVAIRAGDPAPGFAPGVVVNSLSGSFLSSAGRLVVRGQITGPGIDLIAGNLIPDALWAEDDRGQLQLIARAGVPMEVEPGNMLTPIGFTLAGERSYAPSQARQFFNASGRLLFAADFLDDGTTAMFTVDVIAPCRPDYDGVNGLSVADIFAFLNSWFAGETRADFDGVDGLSVADIFAFLNAWFAGCP